MVWKPPISSKVLYLQQFGAPTPSQIMYLHWFGASIPSKVLYLLWCGAGPLHCVSCSVAMPIHPNYCFGNPKVKSYWIPHSFARNPNPCKVLWLPWFGASMPFKVVFTVVWKPPYPPKYCIYYGLERPYPPKYCVYYGLKHPFSPKYYIYKGLEHPYRPKCCIYLSLAIPT